MAVRRSEWRKHVRVGGFLLVFVLFAPVLGIFLVQTLSLIPKRIHVSMPSPSYQDQSMVYKGGVMMDQPGVAAAGIDGDMLWRGERDIVPMPMDAVTIPSWGTTTPVSAVDQKMVKSASLDLRAQSLVWTSNQIQASAKNVGGYVESANVSQPKNDVQTAWLVVRVPVDLSLIHISEPTRPY